MFGRGHWDRGVRRAMRGELGVEMHFSRSLTATCLWDYGEDALVERALRTTDREHRAIRRIAAVYADPAYPLPVEGIRISHRHVYALAAIAYFEGSLRPLARTRRRPAKNRPAHLVELPPDAGE